MSGSELLKTIGIVLLVLIMGMLQVTFSVLEINGVVPNLVLITVFIVGFLEIKKRSYLGWRSFSVVFFGGLFLDLFSTLPLGTEALMLLFVVLITEEALRFLDKINFIVYLILFVILAAIYQLSFHLLSFGSFGFSWLTLLYNLLLATLFYGVCFLVKILRGK